MGTINHDNLPKNDGEVRQLILETLVGLREGAIDNATGTTMAALFKNLNDSMNTSIASAKLSLQMEDRGRVFMKTCRMGRQELGSDSSDPVAGE